MIIEGKHYREIRCSNDQCKALMGYEYVIAGRVAFFCRHCGELTSFSRKITRNQYSVKQLSEFESKLPGEEVRK